MMLGWRRRARRQKAAEREAFDRHVRPWLDEQLAQLPAAEVLRPGNREPRTRGWLELDNGFMFFTDPEMWQATAALFGVPSREEARDG